jgi:putative glutamine amidotransferase
MSVKAPVIGITTYGRDAAGRYTLPSEYVTAVHRAGGLPLLIPPGAPEPERYLDLVDGLILAGGGDIDPARYGGNAHETLYSVDAQRDELELALARAVLRRRQPTLAICRGMQIVNVALGGTLIEHLPAEVGEQVLHRQPPRDPVAHGIRVAPNSRLAVLSGGTDLSTMSWHHQAIRQLAPGLEAVAHAPDGTVEAIEIPGQPWLVAVQWHPELTADRDVTQQRLFDALLAQIRQNQGDS